MVRMLKSAYVNSMHALRSVAKRVGLLAFLDRRAADSRVALWARSLFAVHDSDDLVRLDLPWWNLEAVERVDAFLRGRQGARVVEFGSGASTTWLAKRCGELFSIEHDRDWARIVADQVERFDHVELIVVPPEPDSSGATPRYASGKPGQAGDFSRYVHAIDRLPGVFDLIVVDGRCRGEALVAALGRLADDGMIVFDNPGRRRYQPYFQRDDVSIEKHSGLTACLPYPDATWLLRPRPVTAGTDRPG